MCFGTCIHRYFSQKKSNLLQIHWRYVYIYIPSDSKWHFHPLVGGHQQPLERVTFSPSQKRAQTRRIARYTFCCVKNHSSKLLGIHMGFTWRLPPGRRCRKCWMAWCHNEWSCDHWPQHSMGQHKILLAQGIFVGLGFFEPNTKKTTTNILVGNSPTPEFGR